MREQELAAQKRTKKITYLTIGLTVVAVPAMIFGVISTVRPEAISEQKDGNDQKPVMSPTRVVEDLHAVALPDGRIVTPIATPYRTPTPIIQVIKPTTQEIKPLRQIPLTLKEVESFCSGPCDVKEDDNPGRQGQFWIQPTQEFKQQCFDISVPSGYKAVGVFQKGIGYNGDKTGPWSGTICRATKIQKNIDRYEQPVAPSEVKDKLCPKGPCQTGVSVGQTYIVGDATTLKCPILTIPDGVQIGISTPRLLTGKTPSEIELGSWATKRLGPLTTKVCINEAVRLDDGYYSDLAKEWHKSIDFTR